MGGELKVLAGAAFSMRQTSRLGIGPHRRAKMSMAVSRAARALRTLTSGGRLRMLSDAVDRRAASPSARMGSAIERAGGGTREDRRGSREREARAGAREVAHWCEALAHAQPSPFLPLHVPRQRPGARTSQHSAANSPAAATAR